VESDGLVIPVRHGMGRWCSLGSLYDAPLRDLKSRWLRSGYPAFQKLREDTLADLLNDDRAALPFFNWHDTLARRSAEAFPFPDALTTG